ncbi:TIGR03826 family flagellar region protein [Gracilibacillus marinus]|uniref:TIGR03826 family flagellar region protein n=1 Tax=Gracilibacillus marinus TaxID=630535 RepID=A0ABV8VUX1_9BACI
MAEIANCIRCDKLFARVSRPICHDCIKEEEKKYDIVYRFLRVRENRQATIPEIVEATGVEYELILQFVRENRLRPAQFPNLSYPCERCGAPIGRGKLCENCTGSIQQDLHKHDEIEKVKRRHEEEQKRAKTYFTRD